MRKGEKGMEGRGLGTENGKGSRREKTKARVKEKEVKKGKKNRRETYEEIERK